MKKQNKTTTKSPEANVVTETISVSERLKEALSHVEEVTKTKTQQQALERELKLQLGMLHRGRPVDMSSVRQERLHELEQKRAEGRLRLGRPKYTEAQRVQAESTKRIRAEKELIAIRSIASQMVSKV